MSQINPQIILNNEILKFCEYTKLAQVGIDLTLKEDLILENLQSKNVLLNEVVELPEDIFALFIHRSSFNRKGVLITGSIYDPGYTGVIGCTIYNLSGDKLEIKQNERIGQMVFFKADATSKYTGQYQGEYLQENLKY